MASAFARHRPRDGKRVDARPSRQESSAHQRTGTMEIARDSARDSLRASLSTDLRAPAGSSSSSRLDRMERTLPQARALVIGGSVGGLFAAHLLRQAGWHVRVFERAAGDLGDRGTGIGTREELFAVMRRIGLAADALAGDRCQWPHRTRSQRRRHPRIAGACRDQRLVARLAAAAAGAAGRLLHRQNGARPH